MKRTPHIIGNWKQNPSSLKEAKKLFVEVRTAYKKKQSGVQVVVAPPMAYLGALSPLSPSGRIGLGVQDISVETGGAHTGEVGVKMVQSIGVTHCIVGHSERRAMGETDEMIAMKTANVLKAGLVAIVCVGEHSREGNTDFFTIVEKQITAALAQLPPSSLGRLMIAYEPVWAIGSGKTAATEDVEEMRLFIQKILTDHFGRPRASKVRIIYGGSVHAKNADELLAQTEIDGFLVGGASLKAKEFSSLIEIAEAYAD